MNTSPKFTVVVSDHVEPDLSWEERKYAEAGVVFRHFQMRGASGTELMAAARDADVLIVDQARIDAALIAGLPRCRLIIRHGDGFDNIDLGAASAAGIICANQAGFWSREVAEQSFAMALSLALRIPQQQELARSPIPGVGWDCSRVMPFGSLGSLTVGILGAGKIGRQSAALFASVAKRVVVCDPFLDAEAIRTAGAEPLSLDAMLINSDILCIHVPATDETTGMFDGEVLAKMKRGAILVNAARGSIVDTAALVEALEAGRLAGAALDSTDPEPLPPDHRLHRMANVIITPHMCWYSEDALRRIRQSILNDALGARAGRLPAGVVNREVLDSPNRRLGS